MGQQRSQLAEAQRRRTAPRRDAVRNDQRIIDAAAEVFGEHGADASMEEIAARAGVGVGSLYRRFAGKDALIDELLQRALEQMLAATDKALGRTDGGGLDDLLRAIGQSFADHARYADLLLQRRTDTAAARRIRGAIATLTTRAVAAGRLNPATTVGDVMALTWAMRGVAQVAGEVAPDAWRRFLDIHLAGLRTPEALSTTPSMSSRQVSKLIARDGS